MSKKKKTKSFNFHCQLTMQHWDEWFFSLLTVGIPELARSLMSRSALYYSSFSHRINKTVLFVSFQNEAAESCSSDFKDTAVLIDCRSNFPPVKRLCSAAVCESLHRVVSSCSSPHLCETKKTKKTINLDRN